MSTPLILEPILNEARRAALAGGLARVCRMVVRVGKCSDVSPDELSRQLRGHFTGPLFEDCQVQSEVGEDEGIRLVSIEGYVAPSLTGS